MKIFNFKTFFRRKICVGQSHFTKFSFYGKISWKCKWALRDEKWKKWDEKCRQGKPRAMLKIYITLVYVRVMSQSKYHTEVSLAEVSNTEVSLCWYQLNSSKDTILLHIFWNLYVILISITRCIVFQLSASNSFRYLQTTVKFL